jgi:hypothetical protein
MTWYIEGNSNIDSTRFLGTTNDQPLIIKTNQQADNSEKVRVNPDGNVGIGTDPASGSFYKLDVAGAINATNIHKDGAPLSVSQWTDAAVGISYTGGNVGIAKAPSTTYKLDVDGSINATDYHRDGRALIAAGSTPLGLEWQQYENNAGVFIDVNTEGYHFSTTPVYVTALHGTSHHWATTGGSSVYNPTPTGFRVYIRRPDGGSLLVSEAQSLGWHIQWIATETS